MDSPTNLKPSIPTRELQTLGVSALSGANGSKATPVEMPMADVPDVQSIQALLLIEQYSSLRNEIEKRIEIRQQILTLTLLVAGTFLTVGVQPNIPDVVLLFYPIIAMFLGAIWEHNDLRVGQLNFYIRTEVEKHLGGLGPGWETFRFQTFQSGQRRHKRQRGQAKHPLTSQFGMIVFATRGMFLTTQAMAIIVAAVRYAFEVLPQGSAVNVLEPKQVGISIAVVFLFLVDIAVLIYTCYLVQHKRM